MSVFSKIICLSNDGIDEREMVNGGKHIFRPNVGKKAVLPFPGIALMLRREKALPAHHCIGAHRLARRVIIAESSLIHSDDILAVRVCFSVGILRVAGLSS